MTQKPPVYLLQYMFYVKVIVSFNFHCNFLLGLTKTPKKSCKNHESSNKTLFSVKIFYLQRLESIETNQKLSDYLFLLEHLLNVIFLEMFTLALSNVKWRLLGQAFFKIYHFKLKSTFTLQKSTILTEMSLKFSIILK